MPTLTKLIRYHYQQSIKLIIIPVKIKPHYTKYQWTI